MKALVVGVRRRAECKPPYQAAVPNLHRTCVKGINGYYSDRSSGHINHNSTNIKAKFVLLSHYLLMLREAGIDTGVSKSLTEYKIHASGGYFETLDYQKQAEVPNWQINLASSAQELRYRLERGYFDQSKRQRKFRLFG